MVLALFVQFNGQNALGARYTSSQSNLKNSPHNRAMRLSGRSLNFAFGRFKLAQQQTNSFNKSLSTFSKAQRPRGAIDESNSELPLDGGD